MSAGMFSRFEFLIAWRYLRAKRSEGGVSTMTWISLFGIMLAVMAMIIVLAVRTGFRTEFVDTILGSNAHVTVYNQAIRTDSGAIDRGITDYTELATRLAAVPGVTRAAPLVRYQVLASHQNANAGIEAYGISVEDLKTLPRIGQAEQSLGSVDDLPLGIALGSELARVLGVGVGDSVKLINPTGTRTAFGVQPRVSNFEVVYVFTAGRWDIDKTRAYLPIEEAQKFFNSEGKATEIEVMLDDPEALDDMLPLLLEQGGPRTVYYTWKDSSGAFLRALAMEDNVMFLIMAVLILLSTMNIVSGLIMLVKNKGKDIGILRTLGMTEGTILRVFFICGAGIGLAGTALGVLFGVIFVLNIDAIFAGLNALSGGGVWDPSIRHIYALPAELRMMDVTKTIMLSLSLSFLITFFPAARAARMNPVEALRYE